MWTNKYIGIPYKEAGDDEGGLDCWGLVRLVYRNEFNIELPSLKEIRTSNYDLRPDQINSQIEDSWVETVDPKEGTVILVRVKGLPIHSGLMINSTQFLNVMPGANCVIADITNSRWKNRIIGFYDYTPNKSLDKSKDISNSVILTGTPHPLKRQVYSLPVISGITIKEISQLILDTYKVPQQLFDRIVFTVNGRPVNYTEWETYKLVDGDRVEYRARPGFEWAAAIISELIIYFETGAAFAGAEMGMSAYTYATTVLGYSSVGITVAAAAATIVASAAISYALAPPRPKLNTNDPGSAEAQLLATGNANQLSKYGTIPIVLGKTKIVPPLGAINYISYYGADERDSYLSMLLTWGYGPLKLYNWKPNSVLKEPTDSSTPSYYKWDASSTGTQYSGLKLGNIILDNYTIDAITHKNIYDGDYVAGATNASKESEAGFNSIYGQDHNQQFKNQAIVNDIHPLNGTGSVANPALTAVEATVPNLGNSITNTSEFYNRIEIALHFPEGLRKIRVKGDNENAGKSYSLSGSDNPTTGTTTARLALLSAIKAGLTGNGSIIPLVLKFEYRLGAVTTPASSATSYLPLKVRDKFGNTTDNNGILVLGDIAYKDAFTRVYYADNTITQPSGNTIFPFKGEITVRVTRLTGGRGEAPAEGTTEYQTFGVGDIPEACYLYREQDEDVLDTNSYVVNRNRTIGYTPAPSYTTEAACLAANLSANLANNEYYEWRRDTTNADDGSVSLAQNWRLLHTVNFLSFTASRNAKVLVSPKSKTASSTEDILLSHTALRINSSEQLTGQLEGINGVVQTLGREYTGTDPTVVDLTKWVDLTPINNPASLFLHVLTSPANPKRILWSEITTKVDLVKIQKWWKYCDSRPTYTFAPDNRQVGGKFTYNQVIGQAKSVLDILKDIASAGRASPAQVDGKWTVHIDEEKPNIVQMFTPHNSWDFNSARNLDKAPDGLRINFYDEDNDYQEAEIIVYNKDKTEANAILFESISLPGITKASLAEDHAKWHMAQAIVRRELYTLNTDLEYLICNRGDRVTVTHDVPMWGYGSGRILRRGTFNASFHTLVVELDEPVILDPSKSYGIKIRSSSFSSQSVERGIVTSGIAFQSISRASDGFTVTVVTDTQYAPVTVGDRIVINSTGDFSTTSGSPAIITSVNDTTSPLSFTYIKAGTANATAGAGTISLTNGLYRRIQFDSIVGTYTGTKKDGVTNVTVNLAEEGDLFLFGEYQKVSNDLLVLGIEPDTNKGARLTLVDYAYDSLFKLSTGFPSGITGPGTGIPAYLSQTADLAFRPNISTRNDLDGFTEDDSPPEIGDPISDIQAAENAAPGVYSYRIKLPYANKATGTQKTVDGIAYNQIVPGMPTDITHVECQYGLNIANAQEKSIKVPWLDCTVYISDVQVGQSYKMRLRYVKRDGRVGAWSAYKYHTVTGATTNYLQLNSVTAYLSGTDLVIVPNMPNKPADFKWFEVRIWKDSGVLSSDFWDYSTTNLMTNSQPNDTKVFRILRSTDPQGLKTDLKTFGNPGTIISTTGVRYKIACRAWDGKNYSKNSALFTWYGKTILPGIHTIIPAPAALNIQIAPPLFENRVRTDLWGMHIWISKPTSTTPASPSFTATDSNLALKSEGLTAVVNNLEVDKTHYFRYALISAIDPTVLTISDSYSFIPRNASIAHTADLPPDPKGIVAVAAVTSIIVTLPSPPSIPGTTQSTDYGGGDYNPSTEATLKNTASSTHKSTVVYGKVINSLFETVTFSQVQNNILGEFDEKTVFTLPADPGTVYALFFKYRNKAGNLSANAQGPVKVETGINVQKFLDMLADQITEGQLFKGLQKRLARTDRVPEVDITAGQYSVKIDNGGHVAGFGLSNTNRSIGYKSDGTPTGLLSDGRPFSEFGVVADRFWISGTAIQSDTAPTTNLYHGQRWINTGTAGDNEGKVFGPIVYYNTYRPYTHNPIVFENDSNYWYWELKTKTELDKLIFSGATYVDRGKWNISTAYAVNDYVYDSDSNVYYICIQAYTPSLVTNFATKNPKKLGTFTGSGATFSEGKTLYIYGAERLPTSTDSGAGNNPTYKMNPDYDPKGTFYYITDVTGTEFTLSLESGGIPVVTGIKPLVQYYNIVLKSNLKEDGGTYNLDPSEGTVDNRLEVIDTAKTGWIPAPASSMFPFIVETGASAGVRPGVYMDAAFIKDASITNAKIGKAVISSANIAYLEAGKIKGGTIDADLITAGAISINKIDISTLRGKGATSWTIAMAAESTTAVTRNIDLPPGTYEIILQCNFTREDEYHTGTSLSVSEEATIKAEVLTVTGSDVTAKGKWAKSIDATKLAIKVKNKEASITTQPTLTITDGTITFDLTAPASSGGGGDDSY